MCIRDSLYVVLCLALQPLSYGAVQVRVAEALCLLPVFGPESILGVVLGCFLANLLGSPLCLLYTSHDRQHRQDHRQTAAAQAGQIMDAERCV